MPIPLTVPEIGESVTEAYVGRWVKTEGSRVNKDETIAVLESEKANFDLPAPVSGTLTKILKREGEAAKVGEAIGELEEDGPAGSQEKKSAAETKAEVKKEEKKSEERKEPTATPTPTPSHAPPSPPPAAPAKPVSQAPPKREPEKPPTIAKRTTGDREEEAVAMSPMRRTIAKHLVAAQRDAALLTTFNEVDMTEVMTFRGRVRDVFQQQHGVKLGLMSFFVKATVDALKRFPVVNARIDGDKVVYHNYQDIGIAVSTDSGLVVPVLRDADRMSFAQVERSIADMADRANKGTLDFAELRGGTFTITNGGVFGSLMSTPIVNPPQSGVLGMHTIQERPIALKGQVAIRPMMYLALTYDHRIIDGKEAVSFLKRIKEVIEEPARMLVEV